MQRYFAQVKDNTILLSKDDAFHLTKVMRAKLHEEIIAIHDGRLYLGEVISFNPDHISLYSLTLEEETPLGHKINSGEATSNNLVFATNVEAQKAKLSVSATLEDYEGFSKSRNKLYELHEDFDYDPKNNKNCRPSVEDEAVNNYFIEEYHRVCAEKLTEEEYNVIKLYFDSLGYRDNLPRHIAEKLNIPKARVMSLKDSALKKLRNSNLKEYLD